MKNFEIMMFGLSMLMLSAEAAGDIKIKQKVNVNYIGSMGKVPSDNLPNDGQGSDQPKGKPKNEDIKIKQKVNVNYIGSMGNVPSDNLPNDGQGSDQPEGKPKNEDQLRLCVTSKEEEIICEHFTDIGCVLGTDAIDCIKKVSNNEADITTLDGGDIYLAGKCFSLKPIIAEIADGADGYYAVAVAKQNGTFNLTNLQGAKSCHTGLNKTSGWVIPMSILFPNSNDKLEKASALFNESCVPGAVPGSNLCQLCTPNCDRNSNNFYYGYDGAARCLEETDANVAFVKHTTFLSKTDKENYKLLCKGGSNAAIVDYLTCNLAKVPPHAIVGRCALSKEDIDDIVKKLYETPVEILFLTCSGKGNIFSKSTTELRATYKCYTEYLGAGYLDALQEPVC